MSDRIEFFDKLRKKPIQMDQRGASWRQGERSLRLIWLAGFFTLFISPLHAQVRKDATVAQLLSTTVTSSGQPIVLPPKDAQIVVSIYDVAPGATLQVHKHPSSRYGYVLSGNLRVTNMETGQSDIYKPGDFIVESTGQWHTGANIGGNPLKLLIIDIFKKDEQTRCCKSDMLNRQTEGCNHSP